MNRRQIKAEFKILEDAGIGHIHRDEQRNPVAVSIKQTTWHVDRYRSCTKCMRNALHWWEQDLKRRFRE